LQRWAIAAAEKDQAALRGLTTELSRNKHVDILQKILKLQP
jgi:hypothetical protein